MHIVPDISEIKRIANGATCTVAPLSCEIFSDFITPIEALRRLKSVSKHCYMLESAQANEMWGRYTFLGYNPVADISCIDGELEYNGTKSSVTNPSEHIRDILKDYKSPTFDYLPPFTGGLVGYFSFDYINYAEPTTKRHIDNSDAFKDVDLMLFDKVIVFDNVTQKIIIIVNISLQHNIEQEYEKAKQSMQEIIDILRIPHIEKQTPGKLLEKPRPLFNKEQFCSMVQRAKEYIFEGDIFQIVLSNRFQASYKGSLLDAYRALRTVNPSPYMFYLSGTDVEVAGASPETLVKLDKGKLYTFPLAGTRPRGATKAADLEAEISLRQDEKELAEHNMLVDLGRNDLGKVSEFGSVVVEKLRHIVRFSHVMHIGSTVSGKIRPNADALDAIEAILPAGTLSGAPKIRACQLIGELENNKRGIYGGAIGYIDFSGNMDMCIAIRLLYKKHDTVYVRSGAGIVADSVPEKEFEECLHKAQASFEALNKACEVDA
ncbi:MAG: chorismate-binding protein [Eggerthellaceae bacterium]|nr:chorismate-binding protein [Eggerthellaceae bacterium]